MLRFWENKMRMLFDLARATVVVCGCCLLIQAVANGQSSRNRNKNEEPDLKDIEQRLLKAEESLIAEYKDAVADVYGQGEKIKAMQLLKRLKQLSPKLQGLGEKIEEIEEELMQENAGQFELDTKKNEWTAVGNIAKDKPFRLQAAGNFKLSIRSAPADVNGLLTEQDSGDFHPDVPLGSLMALIVTDGKPGKPFPVGAKLEHTPRKNGTLYLKMNVPNGTLCTGKIKIGVSGNIQHGLKK